MLDLRCRDALVEAPTAQWPTPGRVLAKADTSEDTRKGAKSSGAGARRGLWEQTGLGSALTGNLSISTWIYSSHWTQWTLDLAGLTPAVKSWQLHGGTHAQMPTFPRKCFDHGEGRSQSVVLEGALDCETQSL